MTYQYLTVEMVYKANSSRDFIVQKKFKTTANYLFDSLLFDGLLLFDGVWISHLMNDYIINHVSVSLEPKCNHVLINRNGEQFSKLSGLMSKTCFDAIGKYIKPTCNRQIETESSETWEAHEQEWVFEDQNYSWNVEGSRDVAEKGQNCLRKLKGETSKRTERSLAALFLKESCITDNNQKR